MVETDVQGIADLDMTIDESRRVFDVNDTTTLTIRIKNIGTKDATNLRLRGKHTDQIKVIKTAGTDAQAVYHPDKVGEFTFPLIEKLDRGQTLNLGIMVQGVMPGQATCRVYLMHDEIVQPIEDLSQVRITRGPVSRPVQGAAERAGPSRQPARNLRTFQSRIEPS